MGWNQSVFQLLIVTSGSGFTGLFVYSPAPGPGNLVASIAAQFGTDPYGNNYLGGMTVYNNGAGQAAQFISGGLLGYTGSLAAGWGVSVAAFSVVSTGGWLVGGPLETHNIATGDTTTYQSAGRATQIATSTPQTVNSTTGQAVTGITFPVAVGTYELDALLFCTAGPNNVLPAAAITGPTTSFCSLEIEGMITNHASISTAAATGGGNQLSMGALTNYVNTSALAAIPHGDTFTCKIRGRFTTTATGTVGINVSTSAAANTYTINNGSYATLMPSV